MAVWLVNSSELFSRVTPTGRQELALLWLAPAIALAVIVALTPVLWRRLRLLVTLVHELGHAGAGVLVGRRFTGLLIRSDMSGHAVTVGRTRGAGLVATTWAGYPAPALLGALLVFAAGRGWSGPLLTAAILALAIAMVRVRSLVTVAVFVVTAVALALAWWYQPLQTYLLISLGVLLLIGAWRHVVAVASRATNSDDAAALARLTRVPRLIWVLSFLAVCLVSTLVGVRTIIAYTVF